MAKVKAAAFGVSADGFGAGPGQSLAEPLGRGGTALHDWFFRPGPSSGCTVAATDRPASLTMAGGTVFHFVRGEPAAVLDSAREAAGGRDVRIGGGVATLRALLLAGLIDELHLAVSPVLLGAGEPLFAGLDLPTLGYAVDEHVAGEAALHLMSRRFSRR